MKPVRDLILVEDLTPKAEAKNDFGLIIPGQKLPYKIGKVLSCGPGWYCDGTFFEMFVKAGETVYFREDAGTEVDPNKKHFLIGSGDVMGTDD